jgi:prepilin signal peptidase PulO-like enzyme (type II secretory pathway)
MQILKILIIFILWTVFGSFWWVLIGRERDKNWIKSILFWRSKCDKCWKKLTATELIPIVSFFAQKWKCKKCGTKLSNFYRIIELIMWIVFVLTYLFFPHWNIGELIARLAINWWLTLLIIVDYTKYELHFPMRIITTIIALIFSIIKNPLSNVAISTLAFVLIFLWIYFLGKLIVKLKYHQKWEGFGQWDIYLAWTIWILFPFVFSLNNINTSTSNFLPFALIFIILSSIIWLIYAWIRYLINKNKSKELPFIPAMILALWILLLIGNYFTVFVPH